MPRFDLTRRQFINSSMLSLGMFGITGLSNFVLADEPLEFEEVAKFMRTGQSKIPYITLTDDGPVYPTAEIPWLSDFTAVGGMGKRPPGQLVYLFGQILDAKGRPLPDATVEIWQADTQGRYKHPKWPDQKGLDPNFGYFGKVKTAKDGSYLFKTIIPSLYRILGIARAPHIHLKMRHPEHGVLTTQLYFEGKEDHEIREKDPVWQDISKYTRERLILPKQSPKKFSQLNVAFEDDAVCCKADLAFLLG
ncbi:MAG: protocatechuate 3,4-dioxygenase [Planctomycetaceae bacterium]